MEQPESEIFEISAVARLTGISPHVLRVWERRYQVVEPQRSESRRRQYTQEDIQRLSLLKTLVDNGHAIGSIAKLTTPQLEERLSGVLENRITVFNPEDEGTEKVCRVGIVGTFIRQPVREAVDTTPALRVVGEFQNVDELETSLRPSSLDLIILERDTIFPEDIEAVQKLVSSMQVRRAILIYRFAPEDALQPLDLKRITALRAPVDSTEIRLACIADIQLAMRTGLEARAEAEGSPSDLPIERPSVEIPERAFNDEQLASISRMSSIVKCECPQHLASLLSSLSAFEQYSEQCEDRNQEDAELHSFLHRTTADCRARMEKALAHVMQEEGISL